MMTASMIVLDGLVVFVGISLFCIANHEAGHWIVSRLLGFEVPTFSIGFGRSITLGTLWGTEFHLSIIPLGGYISLPESEQSISQFKRFTAFRDVLVTVSGVIANLITAILIVTWLFWQVGGPTDKGTHIEKIQSNSPAEHAGLVVDEIITAVAGNHVGSLQEFTNQLSKHKGEPVALTVKRGQEEISLVVKPNEQGKIGVYVSPVYQKLPIFQAMKSAANLTYALFAMQINWLFDILIPWHTQTFPGGHASISDLQSPIGIFQIGLRSVEMGWVFFANFLALINIGVAFINLLPVPVLDGGRIWILLYEIIAGKPISVGVRERMMSIGLVCLLGLFSIGLWNDLHITTWLRWLIG